MCFLLCFSEVVSSTSPSKRVSTGGKRRCADPVLVKESRVKAAGDGAETEDKIHAGDD